jgi:hypothetical protein
MQVEPDGDVRGMPIYEGTVGSLLTDPPETLWGRGVERWNDPFVREAFADVRTMRDWAAACRRIDYHFGSDAVKAMVDNRAAYVPTHDVRKGGDMPRLFPSVPRTPLNEA